MSELTHFDNTGASQMVDVGEKPMTHRIAVASGVVRLKPETLVLIRDKSVAKGDVLELARIAAIMGSKRTGDLIPLCHPLRLDSVNVSFSFPDQTSIEILATVSAHERTGVEMEALTAVSVAGLTIYDMCKAVDRTMQIAEIRLEKKTGGKNGDFVRPSFRDDPPP